MKNSVIVGTQWGDEGKGKIVDYLAAQADIIARCMGGANAGHTIVVDGEETITHLIPSGIFHKGKVNIIGNGVAFNTLVAVQEIKALQKAGRFNGGLYISDRAQAITPMHIMLEKSWEQLLNIGTTGRGIGQLYAGKAARLGVRLHDFRHPEKLKADLERFVKVFGIVPDRPLDDIVEEQLAAFKKLEPYVTDTSVLINKLLDEGKSLLVEGAQGTMLDIDHGTYPFVTSSNPTVGGACVGLGVGPMRIEEVVGILKAYTTRVGEGPFPTELGDYKNVKSLYAEAHESGGVYHLDLEDAKLFRGGKGPDFIVGQVLREIGKEFGATTGRPRRTGWLDLVVANHSKRVNSLTSLAVTKLDVLSHFNVIKVCTGYRVDGKLLDGFPADLSVLDNVELVYEELPGWKKDISGVREWNDLPKEARNYLGFIEENVGVPVKYVSVGPGRESLIVRGDV
ncbi:adenylosuccinate synthetase [Candidatus Woesearchaeota archaeon]|nr:MAG: adenylosuccinate synthetase [Candidatus Woesearchaeota archaeon]